MDMPLNDKKETAPPHEATKTAPPNKRLNALRAIHDAVKEPLAGDILYGAEGIAAFVYNDRAGRRKIYHLVETDQLPVFRLGTTICARKSVLTSWIEMQEFDSIKYFKGQS